jgi:hypothetical protein
MSCKPGERRHSGRIAGVTAILRLPGAAKAIIEDVSKHGIARHHHRVVAVGGDVEVDLPGADGPVTGGVNRAADRFVEITSSLVSAGYRRSHRPRPGKPIHKRTAA